MQDLKKFGLYVTMFLINYTRNLNQVYKYILIEDYGK